jgi:hypothetical protein
MKRSYILATLALLCGVTAFVVTIGRDSKNAQSSVVMLSGAGFTGALPESPEIWYGDATVSNLPISVGPFDNYQLSAVGYVETDIIVNPRDPLNFVWTDNRIQTVSGLPKEIFYTTDGGMIWSSSTILSANWDPSFAADSQGNMYYSVIQFSGTAVLVRKSSNGGVSWPFARFPIQNNPGADKPWIAADQTTGPYKDHVYLVYRNATTSVDFLRSTDNGDTWSTPITMGPVLGPPGPDLITGPDGSVVVAWYSTSVPGTLVRISTDGGVNFGDAIIASTHTPPGAINCSGKFVLKENVRVFAFPHIAVDMTEGPYKGYIYHVYNANPPGADEADVFMTRSTDGGVTWSSGSPIRVNDDGTTNDQFYCDVSVDDQGRVWVIWMDSRDDPANNLIWTYGTVSTDGGDSFMPNFRISNQSFDPAVVKIALSAPCEYYLGDYQGMSGKRFTLPNFIGQVNNARQNLTAYLPDYGMSFAKQVDSVAPGGSVSNTVRIPVMGPYAGTVTFVATVTPSPSPGTITFNWTPGNVKTMNGVQDSIGVTAVVSGSVPQGVYAVSITGAESAGPRTHTRSYTIEVGPYTGVADGNLLPKEFYLAQNYPNPFNPSTTISYQLPAQSHVTLKVYNVLGQEVATLVNEVKEPGSYEVMFDAKGLASGVYLYRLTAGSLTQTKRMVLLR